MQTRILVLIAAVAAMTLGPLSASAQDWFASPSQPSGHVTGAIDQPAKGLFRVEITEINGKQVGPGRSGGVWLKPGEYTIKAHRAVLRSAHTRALGGAVHQRREADSNVVELEVEEGKTYHLALDASSPRRSDWKLVVWKIE